MSFQFALVFGSWADFGHRDKDRTERPLSTKNREKLSLLLLKHKQLPGRLPSNLKSLLPIVAENQTSQWWKVETEIVASTRHLGLGTWLRKNERTRMQLLCLGGCLRLRCLRRIRRLGLRNRRRLLDSCRRWVMILESTMCWFSLFTFGLLVISTRPSSISNGLPIPVEPKLHTQKEEQKIRIVLVSPLSSRSLTEFPGYIHP